MSSTRLLSSTVGGEELRTFLANHNVEQKAFAAEMGTHPVTVSRWIAGKLPTSRLYHLAARYVMQMRQLSQQNKKKPGRPLADHGFDMTKAKCRHEGCQRAEKQMWGDKKVEYKHVLLGRIRPVFCNGTPAHPHSRVTRALDLHGNLIDISWWPRRRSLAPFEEEQLKNVRIDKNSTAEDYVNCLQRCTNSLDGRAGCDGFLGFNGHESSTAPERRKLYRFKCWNPQCTELRFVGRLFDSKGREVERNQRGKGHSGERSEIRIPFKAKRCPVPGCNSELRFPRLITEIGGKRYSPALIRLLCLNPHKIDHAQKRSHMIAVPKGTRKGLTFYYNPKRSRWEDVLLKPLKAGSPVVHCRLHGRMRCHKFESHSARVPRSIFERLGAQSPVFCTYCSRCNVQVWFDSDQKKRINRRPSRRKRATAPEGTPQQGGTQ